MAKQVAASEREGRRLSLVPNGRRRCRRCRASKTECLGRAVVMSGSNRLTLPIGVIAMLAIGGLSHAQTAGPTNSLPNPYRSIDNWGTLPEGRTWGSTSAVGIDPD